MGTDVDPGGAKRSGCEVEHSCPHGTVPRSKLSGVISQPPKYVVVTWMETTSVYVLFLNVPMLFNLIWMKGLLQHIFSQIKRF